MNVNPTMMQPVVIYSVAAAGLMLALLLFVWTRLNLKALEQHLLTRQAELERSADAIRESLARTAEEVGQIERQMVVTASAAPRPSLNLSKRSHALRLYRKGDTAEQIATALKIPCQEVELLLKVHRIVVAAL